jgi:hypothetical protein
LDKMLMDVGQIGARALQALKDADQCDGDQKDRDGQKQPKPKGQYALRQKILWGAACWLGPARRGWRGCQVAP